ncbi:MAG: hypothetical protein LQ346_008133 [Caloplaca aetnensis]|nr:MAG: hypothetical protein LQ346_008133 [Caloplaca aetnensis]
MRTCVLWLVPVAVAYASPSVFSVFDDLLAFPQYEVIFSDTFILEDEATGRLEKVASESSTISPSTSSTTAADASYSQEPYAEIARQSPPNNQHASSSPSELPSSYESMILNGRSFLCTIPTVAAPAKNETTKAKDKAEEAAELARATDRGWELLKEMEGNCMYFISGWWSYSFCYNAEVKQFHQLPPGKGAPIYPPVEDPSTPSYVLGRFERKPQARSKKSTPRIDAPKENTPPSLHHEKSSTTQLRAKGDIRYLVQTLSGGTTCDLTGRDRKIEVQFHCHPQSADRIGWIKEVSTCSYLMVIYTPRLCNDVAFLPPRENKAAPIKCEEVLASPSDIPEWRERKEKEKERKLVAASSSGRPVVGSIEVGGMKLVGKEGQRIETPPSTAFTMPGEGAVKSETLAKQDSKEQGGKTTMLSDEDLKKMGLDPQGVQDARRELEEVAGGKGWKLEVFEVADGGRELRGIVEGDEEMPGEEEGDAGDYGEEYEYADEDEEREEGSEETFKDEL